jgi:hypothetical protein
MNNLYASQMDKIEARAKRDQKLFMELNETVRMLGPYTNGDN